MCINNYYFLRQLTATLREKILKCEAAEVFSQNKNELVMGFAPHDRSGDAFYIKAALNPEFSCLSFPSEYARTRKNSVDLFPEIIGKRVTEICQYKNERSFSVCFEDNLQALFKLHGARSNIILFSGDKAVALFKNKMVKDRTIVPDELHRPISQTFEHFAEAGYDYKKLFPTFDKVIRHYMENSGYFELDNKDQWQFLQELKRELEQPSGYYIVDMEGQLNFSLLRTGAVLTEFDEPLQAINYFFTAYAKSHYLEREKNAILGQLRQAHSKTGNYLLKSKHKLEEIENSSRHEEIANIIMANIYNIPPKSEEIELYDFYRNEPIVIKLKKDQTPQKNAENLYRKAKNQKIEIKNIRNNLYARKKELEDLEKHIVAITSIDDIKILRNYIRDNGLKKQRAAQEESAPYRYFKYLDYEILVGKNSRHNDELTQKYAKKNDLWLHAKDTPGSHVVVKFIPGRQSFPKPVIEKAAQLAAYYSKRKNDTLCPVLYTQKKYVRKPKGSLPGQMAVDREEVILVEPAKM